MQRELNWHWVCVYDQHTRVGTEQTAGRGKGDQEPGFRFVNTARLQSLVLMTEQGAGYPYISFIRGQTKSKCSVAVCSRQDEAHFEFYPIAKA